MQGIDLIPIGDIAHDTAEFLTLSLHSLFNVPCQIQPADIPLHPFYDSTRKQYHSTKILQHLLPFAERNNHHVLGVVDVDLYIPILTFVFGEAQLGRNCSLLSVYRLHQQFYGLPEDRSLFLQRCEKEAVHELGHTLSLTHCKNFECVMHYSPSVEGIDLKRNVFCPVCSSALGIRSLW